MKKQSFDFNEICPQPPFGHLEPSNIMEYHDPLVQWLDDHTCVVGYLSDDHCASNPLEVADGLGVIYTAKDEAYYHALGLDHYGDPDMDLVMADPMLKLRWLSAAESDDEFRAHCMETAGRNASLSDDYFRRKAESFWRSTKCDPYFEHSIDDFSFTEDVMRQMWWELRDNRQVGDQDSVLLDCYQHSGCAWSLAGTGTQCRWDTSSNAGVWVPDTDARLEIDRRAKVYTFGYVDYRIVDGRRVWYAQIDRQYHQQLAEKPLPEISTLPEGFAWMVKQSPEFFRWGDAFAWLEQRAISLDTSALGSKTEQEHYIRTVARRRAAEELAQSALKEYNAWLNGDVYGTVVATLNRCDHGDWHVVDSETCWGYYESENSYSALKSSFEEVLRDYRKRLEPESWPQNWSQPNTKHH